MALTIKRSPLVGSMTVTTPRHLANEKLRELRRICNGVSGEGVLRYSNGALILILGVNVGLGMTNETKGRQTQRSSKL